MQLKAWISHFGLKCKIISFLKLLGMVCAFKLSITLDGAIGGLEMGWKKSLVWKEHMQKPVWAAKVATSIRNGVEDKTNSCDGLDIFELTPFCQKTRFFPIFQQIKMKMPILSSLSRCIEASIACITLSWEELKVSHLHAHNIFVLLTLLCLVPPGFFALFSLQYNPKCSRMLREESTTTKMKRPVRLPWSISDHNTF